MAIPALVQPTTAAVAPACAVEPPARPAHAAATVVVVDGGEQVIDLLESVFGAGPFDVVVVESSQHAYSQIRLAQPALVIVSVTFDDPAGFQVLSMLAADETTRHIPVLIHTVEEVSAPAVRVASGEEAAML
jgi:CheY-like chemotaxis protein